jgi:hypothetical protein
MVVFREYQGYDALHGSSRSGRARLYLTVAHSGIMIREMANRKNDIKYCDPGSSERP